MKVCKSSSDLPGQAMFTQQPKISKCGDKLKCKNPGFIKNPTVQINIESQCEEVVATLDSNNNESNKVSANKSKEQKVAHRYKTKLSISKDFQNIPYETKCTLMYLLLDNGQTIKIVKPTDEHNEGQPSRLHQMFQQRNNVKCIFLFH